MSLQRLHVPITDVFAKGKLEAIASLDVSFVRNLFPGAPEEDLLAALHKTRYAHTSIPRQLRHESAEWLRRHGLRDFVGEEILPAGSLPL